MEGLDLPASFFFCPRDDDLIVNYLKKKNCGVQPPLDIIKEYEVYKCNPEQLPRDFKYGKQNEMYFFSTRDRRYQNGSRPNRSAGDGYWKATTADQAVSDGKEIVGYKSRLVFHRGKYPKGKKTNWVMYEYRINKQDSPTDSAGNVRSLKMNGFVLCQVYELRRGSKNALPNGQNGTLMTPISGEPAMALPLPHDVVVKVEDSGTKDRHFAGVSSKPQKNPTAAPINSLRLSPIPDNHMIHTTPTSPNENNYDSDSSSDENTHGEDKRNKRQAAPPSLTRPEKRGRSSNGYPLVGEISRMDASSDQPSESNPPPMVNDPYSYVTCLEELQRLQGLDDIDLVQAVEVLKDHQNAVAFITLRGILRLNWLRMKCRGR